MQPISDTSGRMLIVDENDVRLSNSWSARRDILCQPLKLFLRTWLFPSRAIIRENLNNKRGDYKRLKRVCRGFKPRALVSLYSRYKLNSWCQTKEQVTYKLSASWLYFFLSTSPAIKRKNKIIVNMKNIEKIYFSVRLESRSRAALSFTKKHFEL